MTPFAWMAYCEEIELLLKLYLEFVINFHSVSVFGHNFEYAINFDYVSFFGDNATAHNGGRK